MGACVKLKLDDPILTGICKMINRKPAEVREAVIIVQFDDQCGVFSSQCCLKHTYEALAELAEYGMQVESGKVN